MHNFRPTTLFIGQYSVFLDEVPSTNDFLMKSDFPDGTLVVADCQFAGKGQNGRVWQSSPGLNITMSIQVNVGFLEASKSFQWSRAVSLAVVDVLSSYASFGIKWPNDIFHAFKKIGGILIENNLHSGFIKKSVVGIGLNINEEIDALALPNACSLKGIIGKETSRELLIEEICQSLEVRFLELKNGHAEKQKTQYLRSLLGYQTKTTFLLENGELCHAQVMGVTDAGKLQLLTDGRIVEFNHGGIQFLF